MQALLQPDQSELCAQTCIAMVAGVTLDEAVTACGVRTVGGCSNREIKRGLKALGIKCGRVIPAFFRRGNITHVRHDIPRFAIASVADNRTRWAHAVVIRDGFVFDPGVGHPLPLRVYEDMVITRAYSRRYLKSAHASKRVKARWESFIPILSNNAEVRCDIGIVKGSTSDAA